MKYNLSEIMKEAWRLLRRGLHHITNMSQALKRAWAKAKRKIAIALEEAAARAQEEHRNAIKSSPVVSRLIAAGGRLWEKYGKCRVYFNRREILNICADTIYMDFYKTGNVFYASVNGEKISNSSARDLLSVIDNGVYYDVTDGKLVVRGSDDYWMDTVMDAMKRGLNI